ncbi:hypothetical protein ACFOGI_06440 [Virgibacillus xinjiangensis]|uniref:Uncharacterized protein n=1 Tax=Virgibacillus xinjiangensis TaxID=393090 RepID=A0ABV7CU72_9BACI
MISAGAVEYRPDEQEIGSSGRISAGHAGNQPKPGEIRRTSRKSAVAVGNPPDKQEIGSSGRKSAGQA